MTSPEMLKSATTNTTYTYLRFSHHHYSTSNVAEPEVLITSLLKKRNVVPKPK